VAGARWEETKEEELSVSLAGPLSRFTEAEREKIMTAAREQEILNIIKEAGFFPAKADK
jgi:uncharacterized protein